VISPKDTIAVRQGEELNSEILQDYLIARLPNLPEGNLTIEQFPSGVSNLTYLLKIGNFEVVLRRPPLGPVAAKAHDMKREYRILNALHPQFPLAPKPILYEEDESLIGSSFFIMERRKGIVLDTDYPPGIEATEENGAKVSETMVKTLVELHQIDYQKTELVKMTKPIGFMERQVHGWINRYLNAKTDNVPYVDELMDWLVVNLPKERDATVIHYDYKINNTMFNPNNLSEMVGLFDWEMTTVGDPLADLGVTLSYWIEKDDPEFLQQAFGKPPITTKPGFYTRKLFMEKYAEYSGRDLSNIHYYLTFAYFKLAVIAQQIYYRYKKGQTKDERFAQFHLAVQILISHALQIAKNGME
jgi:aminoglycoside phosphotransferase (APT) family kinase protein